MIFLFCVLEIRNKGAMIYKMEEIFCQASLCYLTNRCDEGFQLISSFINFHINLNLEEQEVFCLISMNIIEERYKSLINLNKILIKTDHFKKRQSIKIYIEIILKELNFYSNEIFLLIKKYLFKSSLSPQTQIFYLKLQGDIHFFLSQITKFDLKLEHIHSTLNFYNQALEICSHHSSSNDYFPLIIYNKALVFIFLTEEYDLAKNILREALNNSKEKTDQIKSLLKYCENI